MLKIVFFTIIAFFGMAKRVFVDYSLNEQGRNLQKYFLGVQNKTFLDIGAYDPIVKSNTQNLYIKGWTGINVQASPKRFKSFRPYRKHDLNLNIAVGSDHKIETLYQMSWTGSSTTSYQSAKSQTGQIKEKTIIASMPTSTICERYVGNQGITMMTVDIEGLGAVVMQSNDWSNKKCRPQFIITQQNYLNRAVSNKTQKEILESFGYVRIQKTVGEDEFYVQKQMEGKFIETRNKNMKIMEDYTIITFKEIYNQIRQHFNLQIITNLVMTEYDPNLDQIFIQFSLKYHTVDLLQLVNEQEKSNTGHKNRHIFVLEYEPVTNIYVGTEFNLTTVKLDSGKQFFKFSFTIKQKIKQVYILNHYFLKESALKIIFPPSVSGCGIYEFQIQKSNSLLQSQQNSIDSNSLKLNIIIAVQTIVACVLIYLCIKKNKAGFVQLSQSQMQSEIN